MGNIRRSTGELVVNCSMQSASRAGKMSRTTLVFLAVWFRRWSSVLSKTKEILVFLWHSTGVTLNDKMKKPKTQTRPFLNYGDQVNPDQKLIEMKAFCNYI